MRSSTLSQYRQRGAAVFARPVQLSSSVLEVLEIDVGLKFRNGPRSDVPRRTSDVRRHPERKEPCVRDAVRARENPDRALGEDPECSEQGSADSDVDAGRRFDRPHGIRGPLQHDGAGREGQGIVDIVGDPDRSGARLDQDLAQ